MLFQQNNRIHKFTNCLEFKRIVNHNFNRREKETRRGIVPFDNSIKEKKSRVEKLVVDETIGRRRRGNCIEFLDNSAFSPPPLSLRFPPFSGNGTSANTSWARVNCADRLSSRFHSTERRINCIFR